ncbi:hypothetical protein MK851_04570 [Tenacibaculum sp. 1B UA]|uniref:hypothetical protein n=1 Tax=unclassified Tenacibaculum TaxID=2635139 RepID=UPI0026E294E3|nr:MULTISPECIES: hypothetical protein [unclassified Tenacibaculum]MDO6676696.1 hypothetical protein [Tenacibaculum sp. 1_MG-2023]MDX8552900.1 hypothetical protein [Tenacibaculum sp. 1B UA]
MKKWVKSGLVWGGTMFLVMTFLFPWYDGKAITVKSSLIGFVIWGIGGILFGLAMKKRVEKE